MKASQIRNRNQSAIGIVIPPAARRPSNQLGDVSPSDTVKLAVLASLIVAGWTSKRATSPATPLTSTPMGSAI